jgi:hypothetical protein
MSPASCRRVTRRGQQAKNWPYLQQNVIAKEILGNLGQERSELQSLLPDQIISETLG